MAEKSNDTRHTWSSTEMLIFVEEIVARKGILFGSHKGSTITKVTKQRNWDAIRDRLNLDCPATKKKDTKCVKEKWKNFKPESKKEFEKYKKSLTETGGGEPYVMTPIYQKMIFDFYGAENPALPGNMIQGGMETQTFRIEQGDNLTEDEIEEMEEDPHRDILHMQLPLDINGLIGSTTSLQPTSSSMVLGEFRSSTALGGFGSPTERLGPLGSPTILESNYNSFDSEDGIEQRPSSEASLSKSMSTVALRGFHGNLPPTQSTSNGSFSGTQAEPSSLGKTKTAAEPSLTPKAPPRKQSEPKGPTRIGAVVKRTKLIHCEKAQQSITKRLCRDRLELLISAGKLRSQMGKEPLTDAEIPDDLLEIINDPKHNI